MRRANHLGGRGLDQLKQRPPDGRLCARAGGGASGQAVGVAARRRPSGKLAAICVGLPFGAIRMC